jgi:hypothetical protein
MIFWPSKCSPPINNLKHCGSSLWVGDPAWFVSIFLAPFALGSLPQCPFWGRVRWRCRILSDLFLTHSIQFILNCTLCYRFVCHSASKVDDSTPSRLLVPGAR